MFSVHELATFAKRAQCNIEQKEDIFNSMNKANPIDLISVALHYATESIKYSDKFDSNTVDRIMNIWYRVLHSGFDILSHMCLYSPLKN